MNEIQQPFTILIAGPYRSGTNDDPELMAENVRAMNRVALKVFRAGHIPIVGEWLALPLIEAAGSQRVGDKAFTEVFHPLARAIAERCDGCLRIGGASEGADTMVALAEALGQRVYYRVEDIPG